MHNDDDIDDDDDDDHDDDDDDESPLPGAPSGIIPWKASPKMPPWAPPHESLKMAIFVIKK